VPGNERARLRRMVGLTQKQLAQRVGMSASQLCLWEHTEIELSSADVEQIARAIETELNRFPTPSGLAQIVSALSEPLGAPA
jgi:transcriptional regulator with XRE-family HTH domain